MERYFVRFSSLMAIWKRQLWWQNLHYQFSDNIPDLWHESKAQNHVIFKRRIFLQEAKIS